MAVLVAVLMLGGLTGGDATAHDAKNKALRRQINAYRAEKGKGALKMKKSLKASAHKQAKKMLEDGQFVNCFNGPRCDHSTTAQLTSYAKKANCSNIAENIAWTGDTRVHTVQNIVAQWKGSDVHKSNMLAKKWKKIGTGVHADDDGNLWAVALFCKPA